MRQAHQASLSSRAVLVLILLTAASRPASAQQPLELELPQMEVVATPIIAGNAVDQFAGVSSVVGEQQIRDLNAQDVQSALRRTPGVSISRYNPIGSFGGGEGGAIFVRGLGSSRPGGEVKTYIDGVPVMMGVFNHPLMDLAVFAGLTLLDTHPADLPYAPDTSVSVGANWQATPSVQLNLDAAYVSSMQVLSQARRLDAVNTEEVDGYFLLNGRLSYALPMLADGSEVFLALENLTDTDYEYRPDYPMPGTTAMLGVNLALR